MYHVGNAYVLKETHHVLFQRIGGWVRSVLFLPEIREKQELVNPLFKNLSSATDPSSNDLEGWTEIQISIIIIIIIAWEVLALKACQ